MNNKLLLASPLFAAGLAFAPGAFAAPIANGTLETKIEITANCAVSAGNAALDFGSHASTETSASASNGGFSVSCTNQTPYTVALIPSGGSGDGNGTMEHEGVTIAYQLYQDSAMQQAWGNSEGKLAASTGTGADQSYTVYGKVTGSMNVPAGTYTDTVTINVVY